MRLSYDEALSALQELNARDVLGPFHVGDIVHGLVAQDTEQVTKQLAHDLGRSLAWVRQRDLVARIFRPDERLELWGGEEPPPPVTWRHHWIAAGTEDPHGWVKLAIEKQLSTRQLEEVIWGEDPDRPSDIIITVDPVAGELHVQWQEGTAATVADSGAPGVTHVRDTAGSLLATRLRMPEVCVGHKVRIRRAR